MATKVTITSTKAPLKNSAKEQEWKRRIKIAIGTLMDDAMIEVEFVKKKG